MKNLLIFLALLCFSLEATPPTPIYNTVNLITGEYAEANCDLSLQGHHPLQVNRSFSASAISQWQFNHPNVFQNNPAVSDGILFPNALTLYEYDEHKRLKTISQTSLNGQTVFHQINLSYNQSRTHPTCTLQVPNAPPIVYHYRSANPIPNLPPYILEKVVGPNNHTTQYHYILHPQTKQLLVAKKEEPNHRYLSTEYDHQGRVIAQFAPLGIDQTAVRKHQLIYQDGSTVVIDALGRKVEYRYQDDHLTAMTHYDQGLAVRSEIFFWEIRNKKSYLSSKALKDQTGEILYCKTFAYDDQGNLVCETLYGNLSGKAEGRISLNEKGWPLQNGVESYAIHYQYSPKFPYQLICKYEDNGIKTSYQYQEGTQQVTAKFIEKDSAIRIRHFYSYDSQSLISRMIVDDGRCVNKEDLTGVTERHLTDYTYTFNADYSYLEWIDEKAFDFASSTEKLIKRTKNQYSASGKLLEKTVFDSAEQISHSQVYGYESSDLTISYSDENQITTHFNYDLNGNCIQTTLVDQEGNHQLMTHQYDFSNRLIRTEKKVGELPLQVQVYSYDLIGNLVKETDFSGNETCHEYDIFGNRIKSTYPAVLNQFDQPYQPTVHKTYDVRGNLIVSTDANGNQTKIAYNAYQKPISIHHPDGAMEWFEYALDGTLVQAGKREGLRECYETDYLARITKKSLWGREGCLMEETRMQYSAFHLLLTETAQTTTHLAYDWAGRVIRKTETAKGAYSQEISKITEYGYDKQGRLSEEKVHTGVQPDAWFLKRSHFDCKGKLIETTFEDPFGMIFKREQTPIKEKDSTTYRYDQLNERGQYVQQSSCTAVNGMTTIMQMDALNRIERISKTNATGDLLLLQEMRYDGVGNKILERHLGRSTTGVETKFEIQWQYDSMNRMASVTEQPDTPYQKKISYQYNDQGKVATITRPDGTILFHKYNGLNQLSALYGTDHSFHYEYSYGPDHRLKRVVDLMTGTVTERSYDPFGNVIAEQLGNGLLVKRQFDLCDRELHLELPDQSSVQFDYEGVFLKSITRYQPEKGATYVCEKQYDLEGRCVKVLMHQVGEVCYQYDHAGRLIRSQAPGFLQSRLYDDRNNVCELFTKNPLGEHLVKYGYDEREQLITEGDHQFVYDGLHNRTSKNQTESVVNLNHQIMRSGSIQYAYDANGCLSKKSFLDGSEDEIQYSYDSLNRLIKVASAGKTIHYLYDAFGRCLTKKSVQADHEQVTHYLFDGQKEIGAVAGNKEMIEFRVLNAIAASEQGATLAIELDGAIYLPIHDLQGSVSMLIDAKTGAARATMRYSAFGEVSEADELLSPWRFAGKRYDAELGYINFGQRYYDPALGRWLTPDPLGYLDGCNRYAYLQNNPLSGVDMWGHFSLSGIWDDFLKDFRGFFDAVFKLKVVSAERNFHQEAVTLMEPVFGKMFLLMNGFYKENEYVGVCGKENVNDKVRMTALNGLLNLTEYWGPNVEAISKAFGNTKVHYILDPTRGWTGDLVKGVLAKCGYATPTVKLLAQTWESLIEEMGGVDGGGLIIHIAHSLGGTNTAIARDLLTPEQQKMIKVIAIASATVLTSRGFHSVEHYVSDKDFVRFMDPIAYFFSNNDVVYLNSISGIPLLDHLLSGFTYSKLLEMLGAQFVEQYGALRQ